MKIISIRKNPQWAETAKAYCEEKWSDVYGAFEDTLNQCLQKENRLPETWLMLGGMQQDEIKGFYQLCDAEPVEDETKRSPWLTTLFVEPDLRGWHYGELLMNHARYEAGKLGFDKMYLATDHIGFYEKYGFREIGLERFAWGRPTKIYEADTFGEVRLTVYDEKNLPGDETYLKVAAYKGGYIYGENGALALHFEKYFAPPDSFTKKWFTILAFRGDELIGRVNFIRSSTDVHHWYLGDLSVKSTERRKGIASRMLQRGIDRIRQSGNGDEYICAYIEEDNMASICLHTKFGFADTGKCLPFEDFVFGEMETTYRMNL